MPTIICSYCKYVGSGLTYESIICDVVKHEKTCSERPESETCKHPIDKINECHPFSSDAGAYFVCEICNTCLEPYEYEELLKG